MKLATPTQVHATSGENKKAKNRFLALKPTP